MPGARGRAGRHDHHAAGRVGAADSARRPGRRPASSATSSPAPAAGPASAARSSRQCASGTACPVSSRMRQPGGPRDDQVDRSPGVEQRHAARPRRTACRRLRRPRRSTAGACAFTRAHTASSSTTRSSSANDEQRDADEAVGGEEGPVHPGQVVRAARSRARRRTRPRPAASPIHHSQPSADQRAEPRRTARTSRRARRSTAAARTRTPKRAGTERTPICAVDLDVLAGVDQVEAADPQADGERRAPRPVRSRPTCR